MYSYLAHTKKLYAPPVTANNLELAEFEGHTHDGHAHDNEQKGNHEVLWVFRHNITKANGGQGDEGKVKGIKVVHLCLPASQNLTADDHVCEHYQQDDQQRDVKAIHLLSDASE